MLGLWVFVSRSMKAWSIYGVNSSISVHTTNSCLLSYYSNTCCCLRLFLLLLHLNLSGPNIFELKTCCFFCVCFDLNVRHFVCTVSMKYEFKVLGKKRNRRKFQDSLIVLPFQNGGRFLCLFRWFEHPAIYRLLFTDLLLLSIIWISF